MLDWNDLRGKDQSGKSDQGSSGQNKKADEYTFHNRAGLIGVSLQRSAHSKGETRMRSLLPSTAGLIPPQHQVLRLLNLIRQQADTGVNFI